MKFYPFSTKIDPFEAIRINDLKSLKKYLSKGGDVNQLDSDGRNLLINSIISFEPSSEMILFLISSGASVDQQDKVSGWCSLHFAIQGNLESIFEVLLQHSENIDLTDAYGNSPLSTAVFSYRGDSGYFIQRLLNAGANPDLSNNYGVSPRSLANSVANYDVSKFFNDN